MIVLAKGDLVLPDRVLTGGTLILDEGRIVAIEHGRSVDPAGATIVDANDCFVVPGFVDVHVHGIEGYDTLDRGRAISEMAARLTRYGVTAFCPTSVACPPDDLRAFLQCVREARIAPVPPGTARVLPAHLESNFISPEYRGAQPGACLRTPDARVEGTYSGRDVLAAIATFSPDVGIVTIAPELPGGIELVRALTAAGHRVSLGHTGADYDTAVAAIEAGARHATHLFNRMSAAAHRAPGVTGAVLTHDEVAAELICDGYHVHSAMCRLAMAAKSVHKVMAITDATAAAGLPIGSSARLGGQRIHAGAEAAFLDDGTLAGSTLTMDRAFHTIVTQFGASVVDAATMCSTTPARELGLTGFGVIALGGVADLVVLDRGFRVVQTLVAGELAQSL